ncbi:T-cell surface glycoprotein CD8 beta chain [Phasianus colchicus]|uniref:T-cell surface glycoprotein CD8 beta chain n=1 Tax=Phasianus colchicus TaxID=9054 RepID=UPI00129DE224|nr:T-cell surface glycoprotein CD8 beta chain [Phasianus colchicus]
MMLDMATMARPWLWLWLWLCLQLPGFCTNLLSSQTPGRILAQTNNSTEIVCPMKREHTGLYWYRWNQGRQHFEFLLFSNPLGKATYGTNISQEKFSIHGMSSHSSSLRISRLHGSDNGTYYCCIIQSSELILGAGTQLSVVDVLPLPSTLAPFTKKPMRCKPNSKAINKKGACSLLVWVPLAATALLLLLSLISTIRRFYRLQRKLWLRANRK